MIGVLTAEAADLRCEDALEPGHPVLEHLHVGRVLPVEHPVFECDAHLAAVLSQQVF